MSEDRTLHVAVDRHDRTWRILEREDGSFSIYYTKDTSPAHFVIYDSLDQWTDPPRVMLARAERAEQRVRALERELKAARALIAFVRDNADCPTSALNQELTRLQEEYQLERSS